jgi:hypothetical protein
MSMLFGLLTSIPGLLSGLLKYLEKRTDADVEKFKSKNGVDRDTAVEMIRTDAVVKQATANVIMAAMNHPVWWVGWCLFVIPVGLYHAAIFILSTLSIGPDVYAVLRVPATQEAWATDIIKSIFLAQAGTGAVAGIAHAIGKRLGK